MYNKELISVIVPIYNVDIYLKKCLESIINQSYKNIEIILIDDGSTDKSSIICDEYKEIDSRIMVLHKNNGGLSSARNVGLEKATGSYIVFVDSDDYLEYNMIELLKKNIDKYKSDISACNFYNVKNGVRSSKEFSEKEFVLTNKDKFDYTCNEYSCMLLYAWNKLYKKEIFDNIRFPEGKLYEYIYILTDLLDKAKKVSFITKPLYSYVYRSNSLGKSFNLKHFDRIDAYDKAIDFYQKKGYYDLAKKEKNFKMSNIIFNLSKMKAYNFKYKMDSKYYYNELLILNKEIKWKDANKYVKRFKIFKKAYLFIRLIEYKIYYFIKKLLNRH